MSSFKYDQLKRLSNWVKKNRDLGLNYLYVNPRSNWKDLAGRGRDCKKFEEPFQKKGFS